MEFLFRLLAYFKFLIALLSPYFGPQDSGQGDNFFEIKIFF